MSKLNQREHRLISKVLSELDAGSTPNSKSVTQLMALYEQASTLKESIFHELNGLVGASPENPLSVEDWGVVQEQQELTQIMLHICEESKAEDEAANFYYDSLSVVYMIHGQAASADDNIILGYTSCPDSEDKD